MISSIPRRMIHAFGGRKKAQIVTAPKTRSTNPMSLVSLYISKHFFLRKLLFILIPHFYIPDLFYEKEYESVRKCDILKIYCEKERE